MAMLETNVLLMNSGKEKPGAHYQIENSALVQTESQNIVTDMLESVSNLIGLHSIEEKSKMEL